MRRKIDFQIGAFWCALVYLFLTVYLYGVPHPERVSFLLVLQLLLGMGVGMNVAWMIEAED